MSKRSKIDWNDWFGETFLPIMGATLLSMICVGMGMGLVWIAMSLWRWL